MTDQGSRWHRFFLSQHWTNIKLALKPAIAISIALSVGQNTSISRVESTTMYLSSIFAVLNMPNKSRVVQVEQVFVSAFLITAVVPFCMLGYLCVKSTRSHEADLRAAQMYQTILANGGTASIAIFYQGRAAAVAGVFLFIIAWVANVTKTIFVPFTFSIVGATILSAVLFLEMHLLPTWALFYSLLKQLLYNTLIGTAISFAVSLLIFPYNAREPYFKLVGDFMNTSQQMISLNAENFTTVHLRIREAREKESSESTESEEESHGKSKKEQDMTKLQDLRGALTSIATALELARSPAKREVAIGHLNGHNIQRLHKLCRAMLIPLFGCNLWSQIASEVRSECNRIADDGRSAFLESLMHDGLTAEQEAELFLAMEDRVAPRLRNLSTACVEAIEHAKRGLHLVNYRRAPFYVRPFVKGPRPYDEEDAAFCGRFRATVDAFWKEKHVESETFRNVDRPKVASLLIIYMETTMHGVATQLLDLLEFTDEMQSEKVMTKRRLLIPRAKRYKKAFSTALAKLTRHMDGPHHDLPGADDAIEEQHPEAVDVFLTKAYPTMLPRPGRISALLRNIYKLKLFLFESDVSAFGWRAAIAIIVGALPAYFAASVSVFTGYRLLWIPLTVLLGLQPVLGRGVAAIFFRLAGTIVGGVLGLIAVEAGRVPAGIIPVFFVTAVPQFYVLQLNPKAYLLPVLLSVITEILVVGYQISADKLGIAALESSGQAYLQPPALMGYRICLTVAGLVIVAFFSIFPALPTARKLLIQNVARHFYTSADSFMLSAVRCEKHELPENLDKAIQQKQVESLAMSTAAHEFAGLTIFEPSPQGKFPIKKWQTLLTLQDNFNTALAVSNSLLTHLKEFEGLDMLVGPTRENQMNVTTTALLALANSISTWQPLPPVLPSPLEAQLQTSLQLSDTSRQRRQNDFDSEFATYLCAYQITRAIMSKYLEDAITMTGEIVGVSGFRAYL